MCVCVRERVCAFVCVSVSGCVVQSPPSGPSRGPDRKAVIRGDGHQVRKRDRDRVRDRERERGRDKEMLDMERE